MTSDHLNIVYRPYSRVVRRHRRSCIGRNSAADNLSSEHAGEKIKWRFKAAAPFDLSDGKQSHPPGPKTKLEVNRMTKPGDELCFSHTYRFDGLLPSMPGRSLRSRALVYENNKLLTWIVSEKEMVSEKPGSFHHAGAFIFFSSSDGTDPRENGRSYEVFYPDAFQE